MFISQSSGQVNKVIVDRSKQREYLLRIPSGISRYLFIHEVKHFDMLDDSTIQGLLDALASPRMINAFEQLHTLNPPSRNNSTSYNVVFGHYLEICSMLLLLSLLLFMSLLDFVLYILGFLPCR